MRQRTPWTWLGIQACLLAGWLAGSVYFAFSPEPFGPDALVMNVLNLLVVACLLVGLPYYGHKEAVSRARAAGIKAGRADAAAALKGRMDLAVSLASKGHSIKVLGVDQVSL